MTLKEFIHETNDICINEDKYDVSDKLPCLRPHAICEDGFIISIQASAAHYSWPKENFLEAYEQYEVVNITKDWGFRTLEKKARSKKQKEALEWFKIMHDQGDICAPHEILETFLNLHGGIKEIRNMNDRMRRMGL